MIVFYSSVVVDIHSSTDNIDIHIASIQIIINPDNINCMLEQHIVDDNTNAHIKLLKNYEHKNRKATETIHV